MTTIENWNQYNEKKEEKDEYSIDTLSDWLSGPGEIGHLKDYESNVDGFIKHMNSHSKKELVKKKSASMINAEIKKLERILTKLKAI